MKSRAGRLSAAVLTAALLAACTTPRLKMVTVPRPAPSRDAPSPPPLRPLEAQPALPPDAAPRSQVPLARYELTAPEPVDLDDGLPEDRARPVFEQGGASWYGIGFHQRKTASGERFDMTAFTAAHKTLPFNTRVCVRSLVNGREVLVRINDRGPYAAGRVIDLSRAAAEAIEMVALGIKPVALSVVGKDDHCAGAPVGEAEWPQPETREAPARTQRKRR
jgi:rare lipoprotein A